MKPNYFHSVILEPEKCLGCTCCLKTCPTEAIRIVNGKASIIAERCIDCGECIRVCPNHAKSAVTDGINVIKNDKYNIALTLPVIYGQFKYIYSPGEILGALKSIGFDEVFDTSTGSLIFSSILGKIIEAHSVKPVISATCPAILRLIQVRFPELLDNILDIETPVEIAARIIKSNEAKRRGCNINDIRMVLITPCTARITSIKKPIGIDHSYIDSTVSIREVYAPMLKALSSGKIHEMSFPMPTYSSILHTNIGGQVMLLKDRNTLAVDGIHNAISILDEVEMEKLSDIDFIEISACPGGCIGGPLVVENRYVASSNMSKIARNSEDRNVSDEEIKRYMEMYDSGLIRLTKKIEPKEISRLDSDINKSIEKMDLIRNISANLPGINCGICGSPTCEALAEDIVTESNMDRICPLVNMLK